MCIDTVRARYDTPFSSAVTNIFEHLRKQQPRINNGPLLERTGLGVVHIRKGLADRDTTVAYRPRRSNNHTLQISTAITNPMDTFSRKLGTKTAVENFEAGHTVFLPAVDDLNDVALIQFYFDPLAFALCGLRS